jgi:hypothetical protein
MFFHGNASICIIILCSIPFLDLVMVLYELKRNQVIKDCCGTWFISYLAQLAHPLHNFHLEKGKVPKQHRVNCIKLKSYDVLQEMHIELYTLLVFYNLNFIFNLSHLQVCANSLQHFWICAGSFSHFWICVSSIIMWFVCEPHTISFNHNASLKLQKQHTKFCVSRNVKTWNNSKPFFGTL